MQKTVLISIPVDELQTLIIDCVNSCLKHNQDSLPQEAEKDELLTIEQAAELLSLSVPTLYGLKNKSAIPVCKQGKRLYFLKSELLNWVKSGRNKTQAETEKEAENYLNAKRR